MPENFNLLENRFHSLSIFKMKKEISKNIDGETFHKLAEMNRAIVLN